MCQNGVVSLYLGAALCANYNFPYANFGRKDSDMYQTRKIGVIGQGHVGAHVTNSLLMQGIADELYPVSYTHLDVYKRQRPSSLVSVLGCMASK